MLRYALPAFAFFVALAAPPAQATEGETLEADFSCFTVSLTLLSSDDPAVRDAANASMMYWLGRIDGAGRSDQLEERVRAIAPTLTREIVAREAQRCGRVLIDRGQDIQAIGGRMQADGL